jgi:hypothetical protein
MEQLDLCELHGMQTSDICHVTQYGLAEDISRSGQKMNTKELPPAYLYSLSAVYIAAAHALKPEYPVKVSFPFPPGFITHKSPRDSSYDS